MARGSLQPPGRGEDADSPDSGSGSDSGLLEEQTERNLNGNRRDWRRGGGLFHKIQEVLGQKLCPDREMELIWAQGCDALLG